MNEIKYQNLKDTYFMLSKNITLLDILLQAEELLENNGIYGYLNWEDGEVLSGPILQRHWVTFALMYPLDNMPDPDGALRLKKLGCKIYYEKNKFSKPIRVRGPEDYDDPKTKKAKKETQDIWVVTIKIPRHLINAALEDYVDVKSQNLEADFVADESGQEMMDPEQTSEQVPQQPAEPQQEVPNAPPQ